MQLPSDMIRGIKVNLHQKTSYPLQQAQMYISAIALFSVQDCDHYHCLLSIAFLLNRVAFSCPM